MKYLLISLLFLSQLALAGEKELLERCEQAREFPGNPQTTIHSLIKIGSGLFSFDPIPCTEVVENLKQIKDLHLRGGTFEYLYVDSLDPILDMDWIESLNISGQGVSDITPLAKLKLKELHIRNTKVENLSQLSSLKSLKSVTVDINNYYQLNDLAKISTLEEIDLSMRDMGKAYLKALAEIPNLRKLTISHSSHSNEEINITALDSLKNLQDIRINLGVIDARELVQLPLNSLILTITDASEVRFIDHLGLITSLESLMLPGQGIEDTRFLKNLVNLRTLYLDNNKIQKLDDFANLTKLERLSLNRNKVWMSKELALLTNLKYLSMYDNRLGTSVNLETLVNLEELNLRENSLYGVKLGVHPKLKKLSLARNNIRSRSMELRNLNGEKLPALEQLDLSQNKLAHLANIGTITSLERLILDDNKLRTVNEIMSLTNLKRMSARSNLIEKADQVCPIESSEVKVCDYLHQEI